MSTPSTVYNLLVKSMQLVGIVTVGETPTADEINDAKDTLEDLLEAWSIEKLAVWPSPAQTFNTIPGVGTYTVGPGGTFNASARPVSIDGIYTVVNGESFVSLPMDEGQYSAIEVKDQGGNILQRHLYIANNPLGQLILWPIPSAVVPLTMWTARSIANSAIALTDVLVWPPGYFRAMRYNLAVHLAPEYGRAIPPEVAITASASKGRIKAANIQPNLARIDSLLTGDTSGTWTTGY
jgi:hypothetical protein